MKTIVFDTAEALGAKAGADSVARIRQAISEHGEASIIVATGMSQFAVLEILVQAPDVKWDKVTAFHLDEYIGISEAHPASFRKYLRERFVERLSGELADFHYISGEGDCAAECRRIGDLISQKRIDLCLAGVGENGHLAFNDPPADFETDAPYLVVDLDEACRRQQLGEGWFASLEEVPTQAISMSIRQIMKSHAIICSVDGRRKAQAIVDCLDGPVTPDRPASILQQHDDVTVYIDTDAASALSEDFLGAHTDRTKLSTARAG